MRPRGKTLPGARDNLFNNATLGIIANAYRLDRISPLAIFYIALLAIRLNVISQPDNSLTAQPDAAHEENRSADSIRKNVPLLRLHRGIFSSLIYTRYSMFREAQKRIFVIFSKLGKRTALFHLVLKNETIHWIYLSLIYAIVYALLITQ